MLVLNFLAFITFFYLTSWLKVFQPFQFLSFLAKSPNCYEVLAILLNNEQQIQENILCHYVQYCFFIKSLLNLDNSSTHRKPSKGNSETFPIHTNYLGSNI